MEKTDEISGEMQPVYKFSCKFEMCKENIAWKKHMRNRKTELNSQITYRQEQEPSGYHCHGNKQKCAWLVGFTNSS